MINPNEIPCWEICADASLEACKQCREKRALEKKEVKA